MESYASRATVQPSVALYTQRDVIARCNFSKSHLYNLIARCQFPQPALRCGPRFTRWSASEVNAWLLDPAGWIRQHSPQASNRHGAR
ncbi:MAG: hypothetical protein RL014_1886 [Pseudomonadota bacterium]|jgi:predicted DNA-binding transcriptional regulator AlpA